MYICITSHISQIQKLASRIKCVALLVSAIIVYKLYPSTYYLIQGCFAIYSNF